MCRASDSCIRIYEYSQVQTSVASELQTFLFASNSSNRSVYRLLGAVVWNHECTYSFRQMCAQPRLHVQVPTSVFAFKMYDIVSTTNCLKSPAALRAPCPIRLLFNARSQRVGNPTRAPSVDATCSYSKCYPNTESSKLRE